MTDVLCSLEMKDEKGWVAEVWMMVLLAISNTCTDKEKKTFQGQSFPPQGFKFLV